MAKAARFHPRLIELAVGKLKQRRPDEIISELNQLTSRDTNDALTEMIRQTVAQMEAHDSDAPSVLRHLAVCRGGFTFEAAAAISEIQDGERLDLCLNMLIDYNFMRFDGERYSIDELVRLAVGEDEEARRGHFNYYYEHARMVGGDVTKHNRYQKLEIESDNLDAAFAWALEADPMQAYWLANACQNFLANRGRFADRMAWFTALEKTLADITDEYTQAAFYNSLGIVYRDHPFGVRADNLRRAVAAYQEALRFSTLESAPLDYATTQNNLGIAYRNLSAVEDRNDNLHRAVEAYQQALEHFAPQSAPLDYATMQNNLGNMYGNLSEVEDRSGNLRRAVSAYEEALRFVTADVDPLHYASTQNNLGAAYSDLARLEDRADNLSRAIISYQEALRFRTPNTDPLRYATTQNNLGNAYRNLAKFEDRDTNLRRAIDAHQEALRFYTPDSAPLEYATTQANLGLILEDSGDLSAALVCWREAEKYYRAVGYIEDADQMRRLIDDREAELGGDSTP
ncbi:MAG: tetratricopeptide repeat protein [Chloroflexota bacterium]